MPSSCLFLETSSAERASTRAPGLLGRRAGGLAATLVVLLLAACGGGDEGKSASGADVGPVASAAAAPATLGTLKESGFGQDGQYVWVTSVVHNNSEYVGQTVTVSFNLLDDQGEILATESQVESFDRPQADHIVGTQVDVGKNVKVAKVEASLDVQASGAFSDKPFPAMPVSNSKLGKDEYGSREFSFQVANPLVQALKSPRIQVLCRDASDAIVGGGSAYPELLPAGGRIKVDVGVMTSGVPATCTANVGAPSDWEGSPEADSSTVEPSAATASGSAEGAFKTWVEQFTAKDWGAQYATLFSGQQALISKREYLKCQAEGTPSLKWSKVLSVQKVTSYSIPGTSSKVPATKVSVQVTSQGIKVPVDAHMLLEDGRWKWTMTSQNLARCAG